MLIRIMCGYDPSRISLRLVARFWFKGFLSMNSDLLLGTILAIAVALGLVAREPWESLRRCSPTLDLSSAAVGDTYLIGLLRPGRGGKKRRRLVLNEASATDEPSAKSLRRP